MGGKKRLILILAISMTLCKDIKTLTNQEVSTINLKWYDLLKKNSEQRKKNLSNKKPPKLVKLIFYLQLTISSMEKDCECFQLRQTFLTLQESFQLSHNKIIPYLVSTKYPTTALGKGWLEAFSAFVAFLATSSQYERMTHNSQTEKYLLCPM